MSWGKPLRKPGRASGVFVSVAIRASKSGTLRLRVDITKGLAALFGSPQRVNAELGEREHAGKLRISFKADGEFKLTKAASGALRVLLPVPSSAPAGYEFPPVRCVIDDQDRTHIVLALPIDEWREAVAGEK